MTTSQEECSLEEIESYLKEANFIEQTLLLYAKKRGLITHCMDCEESLSSRGRGEYRHTCRCCCEVCQ